MPPSLTARSFSLAIEELTARDVDLAAIVERFGPPPMWERPPVFGTLVHIVLEQQVSLASARAAFERLAVAASPLTPERFLELSADELLTIGFSRQKAGYARALAGALIDGSLDLGAIAGFEDEDAYAALVALPGIGPWTATIYLLMALRRPDVWPAGDIALAAAAGEVKRLGRRPAPDELLELGEAWRPWRSVAARMLWHDYLSRRGRG